MEALFVQRINSMRVINTRFGDRGIVELSMKGGMQKYWLTPKQYKQLYSLNYQLINNSSHKNCELYVVVDGDRYVWSGIHTPIHSDLDYLESRFFLPQIKTQWIKRKFELEASSVNPALMDD